MSVFYIREGKPASTGKENSQMYPRMFTRNMVTMIAIHFHTGALIYMIITLPRDISKKLKMVFSFSL